MNAYDCVEAYDFPCKSSSHEPIARALNESHLCVCTSSYIFTYMHPEDCMCPSVARLLSHFSQPQGNVRPPTECRVYEAASLEAKAFVKPETPSLASEPKDCSTPHTAERTTAEADRPHGASAEPESHEEAHSAASAVASLESKGPDSVSSEEPHRSPELRMHDAKPDGHDEDKHDNPMTKSPMRSATVSCWDFYSCLGLYAFMLLPLSTYRATVLDHSHGLSGRAMTD
jgi:hypothetical protein